MSPIPLSQWADQNGIPRRTAYNWAKSGRLNVPLHRTLTGRLVVLDDTDADSQDTHPFVAAYAEALGLPVGTHAQDNHHSPVLEAWGVDLYEAVDDDLRPLVLQLALTAACARVKRDVWWRLADWLGRVELADWYISTGFPQVAALIDGRGEITDQESFLDWWPTGVGSHPFWQEFDQAAVAAVKAAGLGTADDNGAVEWLAENALIGLDNLAIAPRRERLRATLTKLAGSTTPSGHKLPTIPEKMELWDLRALFTEPMYALARPHTRRTAAEVCAVVGWDPESPAPPDGHPLREVGWGACTHTAAAALLPYLHDAHIREIEAFRRIALGKPFRSLQPR